MFSKTNKTLVVGYERSKIDWNDFHYSLLSDLSQFLVRKEIEVNKRKEKTVKFNVIQILIVKQRFSLFNREFFFSSVCQ